MVPFALPGELVIARVHRNHKNYSEADLVRVIEASPARVEPRCPIFGRCGGCQYQNLRYDEQLSWKRRQLAELLQHMAGVEFPVEEVIASPREYGYRSKITPHFPAPQDGRIGAIGFLEAGSRTRIQDVPRCEIAMPEINERLSTLREEIFRTGPERYQRGATLLLRAAGGRVITDNKEIAIEEVDGIRFEFQAGDFFQNNPFILPAFVRHVAAEASRNGATHLVDAYCGSGLFALGCAQALRGGHGDRNLGGGGRQGGAQRGDQRPRPLQVHRRQRRADLCRNRISPRERSAVIVDPPRAGCGDDFLRQLFEFGPATVVYVSCNPATQMRDLVKFLEAGFELRKVQPFDLFPQTRHLECVMTLARSG